MTTIECNFKNSISQNLDGYILVGLESWLMKDGDATSYTPKVGRVEFVDGSATLDLAPSELEKVTYTFEVWYYDEVTTSDPETGEPVITVTELLLVPKFYAMVPDSDDPILFNDLAKQSGINRDNIDTAISAIARRLYNEDIFWTRLQQNLFVPKGYYDPLAWYTRGDVITWDGGSYLYYYPDRSQGVLPSTVTHWQKLAERGATGTGINGNDAPFDASWDSQLDAPSRNTIYDALQQYALASTVAGFAPIANPAFTGTPTRTVAPGDSSNSSELATTAWTQAIVATVKKSIVPVGTVVSYAGSSSPIGWVLCDGRVLDRTAFADLFSTLGTTYNTGGESGTQFRVPDLRGRVAVAPDNMGGSTANRVPSATNIALTGGASTVTLSVNEMPSHSHSLSGGATNIIGVGGVAAFTLDTSTGLNARYTDITNSGSGQAHQNMQPYITLNYIIYTGV